AKLVFQHRKFFVNRQRDSSISRWKVIKNPDFLDSKPGCSKGSNQAEYTIDHLSLLCAQGTGTRPGTVPQEHHV
ncbi:MAG TPA: hypothetical protein VH024_11320, partial [Candidatus Angelobacter sp.]|nr:hypothetical protein [Candidatus Angelobacter sp.]